MSEIRNKRSGGRLRNTRRASSKKIQQTEWRNPINCDVPTEPLPEEGVIAILDRHHSPGNSRTPPHMIEHRANVMALKSLNPDILMSVNSVGSMRNDMPPGIIGISSDVLDLSVRPWTFYDRDAVHYDRTSIFDNRAMTTGAD